MDFLKAEIERKKRQIEEANVLVPSKKFFKRGDLAAKYEEEYRKKEQVRIQKENDDEEKEQELKKAGAADEKPDTYVLPRKEVIRRLRERNEPILLFGETEVSAFQRLKRLEIQEPDWNKGLRNDFQEALERVDQAYLNEILKTQGPDGPSAHDVKVTMDPTTMDDIQKMRAELGKGDSNIDNKVIYTFMKFLFQRWGEELNGREEQEKVSMRGKIASATYAQTQAYLKPLFKKLKSRSVPDDILESLVEIVQLVLDREYVKANDAYLQMAIGNAPWPIGVTMVGIHARTGREKIFSKHVAHVLNDETQRKYIQALKRLMTKCQQFFPTVPSKSVEYHAFH